MGLRCRLGLHSWVYLISKDKVVVRGNRANRADYKICAWCETVKDIK